MIWHGKIIDFGSEFGLRIPFSRRRRVDRDYSVFLGDDLLIEIVRQELDNPDAIVEVMCLQSSWKIPGPEPETEEKDENTKMVEARQ